MERPLSPEKINTKNRNFRFNESLDTPYGLIESPTRLSMKSPEHLRSTFNDVSSPELIGGRANSFKKQKLSEPSVSAGGVVYLKGGAGHDNSTH
jgi:hypothetical protein